MANSPKSKPNKYYGSIPKIEACFLMISHASLFVPIINFYSRLLLWTVADDSCHSCNQSYLQPYNYTVHKENQTSSFSWELKLKLESGSRFVPSVSPSLSCGLHTARARYCPWMIMQLNPTLKIWAQVCNPTLKIWTQVCNPTLKIWVQVWKPNTGNLRSGTQTQYWKLSELLK